MKYLLGLNSEELEADDIVFSIFDGVGMIRGENLCIKKMQYFPLESFRKYVIEYLNKVSTQFEGKPVWYRTADLVPHQINVLDGSEKLQKEEQFLLGTRGVRRNLISQEAFLNEISSFMEASKKHKNLGIMFPFVSKVEEMQAIINLLRNKFGYQGKIGMMLETPASIIRLAEFDKLGIDNYTIGLNDLTSLILGADRSKKQFYSMTDKSVKDVIKYATDTVHSFGKEITVAGYLEKEIVDYCSEIGVDSCNIHYDLIPQIFPNLPNPEKFAFQYRTMKDSYKRKKIEYELRQTERKNDEAER